MSNKLREYIDQLFAQASPTRKTVEVKEEILQNLTDKYNDLLEEGKSEEAAYNIAVASIGDIGELILELEGDSAMPNNTISNTEFQKERQRGALLTSIAVMLYILCVVPMLLLEGTSGIVAMFVMVALATGLLIFKNMTRSQYFRSEDTMAEEFMEWRSKSSNQHQIFKSVSSALWAITLVIYFAVSFWTFAWHITWIIFLIGVAAQSILKAVFDLRG